MASIAPRPERKRKVRVRGPEAPWRLLNGYPIVRQWGDLGRIAQACGGLTVQSVSEWKRVPEKRLPAVAAALNVPPGVLRPDLHLRRIAVGEPSSLLELLLAWRIVCAARRTLHDVEAAVCAACDHEAHERSALKHALRRYRRDKADWEPRWLEMQRESIAALRKRVREAVQARRDAQSVIAERRRWLVQTGIPAPFLDGGSSR